MCVVGHVCWKCEAKLEHNLNVDELDAWEQCAGLIDNDMNVQGLFPPCVWLARTCDNNSAFVPDVDDVPIAEHSAHSAIAELNALSGIIETEDDKHAFESVKVFLSKVERHFVDAKDPCTVERLKS